MVLEEAVQRNGAESGEVCDGPEFLQDPSHGSALPYHSPPSLQDLALHVNSPWHCLSLAGHCYGF